MTGKTHIAGGVVLSLWLAQDFVSAIMICLGSILPDIDHPDSALGKLFPIIPKIFKHRGFLHAVWVPIILYFVYKPLCYGYALHLLFDMLTVMGIKPFYPANFTVRIPIVTTGGKLENIFFILLIIGMIAMTYFRFILPIL